MVQARERVIEFVRSIGLNLSEVPEASGFIKHVRIERGGLLVSPLAPSSAILHEAGHLAVIPGDFRGNISGDVDDCLEALLEGVSIEPESPLYWGLVQASDQEATAWAWLAGRHLGLEETEIIADREYAAGGKQVRQSLKVQAHPGYNGLRHSGMLPKRTSVMGREELKLSRWLQPTFR